MNILTTANAIWNHPIFFGARLALFHTGMGNGQVYSPTNDPFKIDDYHYIDTTGMGGDGKWYSAPPNPPYDNEWGGRASPELEDYLNRSRNEFYRQLEEERNKLADTNQNGIPDIHESTIDPKTKTPYNDARNWIPLCEPLTLDLDGDGLETTGIATTNPILFDHDGDGVKNGTGWVSSDDAFLVLDKNSNGSIDNGRELFGDSTIKSNGQLAIDGFDALADLDSNADGVVNASDTSFNNLRLWRDLNQDGISQTGELYTLASQNIIGINVAKTANSQTLPNGNQIGDLGTFTKTDGSTGGVGAVTGNLADVYFASDTFHRSFPNVLDTTSVATLPDMQGSGKVRDLREAATQSSTLQSLLTQFSAATTRVGQMALIDQLLDAWADTGGMAESMTQRVATGYTKADGTVIPYILSSNITAEWIQKLHIIESFNGSYFFGLLGTSQTTGAVTGLTIFTPTAASTSVQIFTVLNQTQLDLLQQSYDAIKSSVYDALLLQTRFKPLLDQISLVIDEAGIKLDFMQVTNSINQQISANAVDGLINLIEFNFSSYSLHNGSNWNGWQLMAQQLEINQTPAINEVLTHISRFNTTTDNYVIMSEGGKTNLTGADGNDVLMGLASNNFLDGGAGADIMIGGKGFDTYRVDNVGDVVIESSTLQTEIDTVQSSISYSLGANLENLTLAQSAQISLDAPLNGTGNALNNIISGNRANNILIGATGNDTLIGGKGNDTYIFAKGDGIDFISDFENGIWVDNSSVDILQFTNIKSTDISGLFKSSGDLIMQFGTDQITIQNQLYYVSATAADQSWSHNGIDQFKFSDGVVWGTSQGDDTLLGQTITQTGTAANESIYGGYWTDIINGGAGDDSIYGDSAAPENTYRFGNNYGGDTLNGGAGNDFLISYYGSDTYLFAKGDGVDFVRDIGLYSLTLDVIKFTNVNSNEITVVKTSGDSFVIKYGISDQITEIGIEKFQFSDGVTLNESELIDRAAANIAIGTVEDDIINGWRGRDILTGDKGNDTLNGGQAKDTYIFTAGDGIDIINEGSSTTDINTVQFTNVKSTELRSISSEYSGDLVVRYGISDQFTINYAYTSIFEFKFSDNVTWTNADIKARAVITGTVGDDTLEGFNTNDILSGSLGNDTLYGKDGSDTYLFAKGDGIDWLSDNTGTLGTDINTVKFTDVKSTDVTSISQYYGNLIINYGVSDQLTVYGQLDGGADGNGVQVFKFSDGVNWTRAYLESQPIMSFGTSGNDILFGGSGIDNLVGGLGNDTYSVNNSGDLVTENLNEGTDSVQSIVSYTLGNNVENLTLFGVANINATGNALNNILMGNIAANILTGGAGNDTYTINDNLDTIIENLNEGIDLINSSITYSLVANVENLTLTGTTAINGTGNNLANSLTGNSANNILDGGIGIDTLKGGAGNDTYIVDNSSDIITESASAGTDLALSSATYTLSSNVENLTLTGTANINGTGNNANNMIIGNAGNNTLNGSTGNDTLMGGLGDDIYVVDVTADIVTEAVNEGTDTVQSAATYTLSTNVENLTLTGLAVINGTGNASANTLTGNSAANVLTGGAGNDTLNGGAGADTLKGGADNDTYMVDNTADIVTENANEGTDLVNSSVTFTIGSNVENLTLTGTTAINGTGNSLANTITGNSANNILDGGTGADLLIGGAGNDIYIIDNIADVITEAASAGTDVVQSSVNYTLAANVENLTLTGISSINATGNTANNSLTGNTGNNILDGGIGNDTLMGGLGNDTYIVDATGDVVTESSTLATEIDTVQAAITYPLGANLEKLILTGTAAINGTGNILANTITGNTGNNTLNGGTGIDTLIGGLGNDIYVVDDVADIVTETSTLVTEIDSVQASTSFTLSTNVENLTLTGTTNINATGNTANNTLTGNIGNNILDGGIGNDTLIGGLGNDTYVVDATGDVVTESSTLATEIDTVQAAISYTLGANLENLILTGTAAINGIGNTLANTLTGNAGNNTLNGGTGIDTLIGGLGNDIYVVDDVADIVTETSSLVTEIDSVQASVSYTLSTNVENLTLTGTTAINGTGNVLANTITGNSADNILDGGIGADTFIGGTGNDTYIVDNTGDAITEAASAGTDLVQSSVNYTLAANVENLILTGLTAINGTGNALNNFLFGNSANNTLTDSVGGNDVLQGLAGIDSLNDTVGNNLFDGGLGSDIVSAGIGRDLIIGGTGNDTITTGTGYDVIVFNKGDGADIINASTGADNTLSLGGNFAYSDLSLTKSTNDLILKMGTTDQITLKDWYLSANTNKSVVNLQVIAEAIQGFNLGSADALRNNKIENFNFTNLVAAFDTAGATANWQLTDARLTTHLQAGSDTAAIGGDLAYQYAKNSNLTGMGLINAQSVISNANFGQTAQALNNPTVWQAELVKLG